MNGGKIKEVGSWFKTQTLGLCFMFPAYYILWQLSDKYVLPHLGWML